MQKQEAKQFVSEVVSSTTPAENIAHAITLAAVVGALPSIATVLSIILISLKIWETDTIRKISGRAKKPDGGE